MWLTRFTSRRGSRRRPEGVDSGTATLEYVGVIALAAMLVLAVCGAMRTSALSAVATDSVHCVTTFHCGRSGPGPAQPATGAASVSGSAAQGTGRDAAGTAGFSASRPGPVGPPTTTMRQPIRILPPYPTPPWQPVQPPRPTPPWNPIGHPFPPRVVWCEVNVGCGHG